MYTMNRSSYPHDYMGSTINSKTINDSNLGYNNNKSKGIKLNSRKTNQLPTKNRSQTMSTSNSNINDIITKLKNDENYIFSRDMPPKEITEEMLKIELDCGDLRMQPDISKETLWNAFYVNNFKQNKFGIFIDPLDKITDTSMMVPLFREMSDLSEEEINNIPPLLPYDAKKNPFLQFITNKNTSN